MNYYNSRYNFCFETGSGLVLYNAKSGGTVKLNGGDATLLGGVLIDDKKEFDASQFDEDTLKLLVKNSFLVEDGRDELLEIRERYWRARGETPMVITITTTMNCNLGCYYCYEERTNKKLEFEDIDNLLEHVKQVFSSSNKKSLHVDWYGGEPLLNIQYLEKASYALQAFCTNNNINYHASIISNGTLWPSDLSGFLTEHKIRQVQISFDGMKENHNLRRRYRKEFGNKENNSFDIIVNLLDNLLDLVHVDIRFNIDWKNKDDVFDFLDFAINRGWFKKTFPPVFQPARISSYTEKAAFLSKRQLAIDEFDAIRLKISEKLNGSAKVEESEVPDGFPFPKNHVCAALATESVVLGADKLLYRCGLQVGETHRAVGSLDGQQREYKDSNWWNEFDPTTLPSCSKCSFLPVCFGGCPKKHLEKEQFALDEQSIYWRNNLAKKVVNYVGETVLDSSPLPESSQFRNGY